MSEHIFQVLNLQLIYTSPLHLLSNHPSTSISSIFNPLSDPLDISSSAKISSIAFFESFEFSSLSRILSSSSVAGCSLALEYISVKSPAPGPSQGTPFQLTPSDSSCDD